MLRNVLVPAVVFVVFTVYSLEVAAADGLLGFVPVVMQGGWALQLSLDLVLAVTGFLALAVPEAKRLDIPVTPYVIASLTVGSVGVFAFFVHRGIVLGRRERALAHGGWGRARETGGN